MLRRALNVASILCCVLCVALMGVWLRSYRQMEGLHLLTGGWQPSPESLVYGIKSESGHLTVWHEPARSKSGKPATWRLSTFGGTIHPGLELQLPPAARLPQGAGFEARFSWLNSSLTFPYWFLVFATGFLAMICQLRWPWRFTLRHLFIVTTFLAVVLGMIACLDRSWIGK